MGNDKRKTWFLIYFRHEGILHGLLSHLHMVDTIHEYIIARELHADGHPHLHAYVKYDKGVTVVVSKIIFDYEKHGDYNPARSPAACIKYCQKGGDYITNLNL